MEEIFVERSKHSWVGWVGARWGSIIAVFGGGMPHDSRRGERRETVDVGMGSGEVGRKRFNYPGMRYLLGKVGKANYESCYGKCWLLISSGLGVGSRGQAFVIWRCAQVQ